MLYATQPCSEISAMEPCTTPTWHRQIIYVLREPLALARDDVGDQRSLSTQQALPIPSCALVSRCLRLCSIMGMWMNDDAYQDPTQFS
eukprot:m.233681 g.233681  ORF g.233681 m.233681 type:complete len:88 (-) comp19300_c0_seq2:270-533(-)